MMQVCNLKFYVHLVQTSAVLSLWLCDPHERDAIVAKDAVAQGDAKYRALVEIYVGRKSSQLLLIQQAYQARFKKNLDQEISRLEPPSSTQRVNWFYNSSFFFFFFALLTKS